MFEVLLPTAGSTPAGKRGIGLEITMNTGVQGTAK